MYTYQTVTFYFFNRRALPAGLLHGLTYGLSSCIIFFMVAVVLPFGAYQVSQADSHIAFITFQNFFTVLLTIAMSGLVIGKTTAFIPKYISARVAASRVFVVLERESLIDINHTGGITLVSTYWPRRDVYRIYNYPVVVSVTKWPHPPSYAWGISEQSGGYIVATNVVDS